MIINIIYIFRFCRFERCRDAGMIQRQGQDEQNAQNIQDQDGQQIEHQNHQEERGLYQQNHSYGYSHQGYYQPQLYTGYQDQQQGQYNQNSIGLNQGQYQHDGKASQEKEEIKHDKEEMILLTKLDQKFTSLAISNKDNKIRNANEQI